MHINFQQKVLLRTSSCPEWTFNIKLFTKYSWMLPYFRPSFILLQLMVLVFLFLCKNLHIIILPLLINWVNQRHMKKMIVLFSQFTIFSHLSFFLNCILDSLKFFLYFLPNSLTSHHPLFKFIFWLLESLSCFLTNRLPILSNTCGWVGGQLKAYIFFRWSLIAMWLCLFLACHLG